MTMTETQRLTLVLDRARGMNTAEIVESEVDEFRRFAQPQAWRVSEANLEAEDAPEGGPAGRNPGPPGAARGEKSRSLLPQPVSRAAQDGPLREPVEHEDRAQPPAQARGPEGQLPPGQALHDFLQERGLRKGIERRL